MFLKSTLKETKNIEKRDEGSEGSIGSFIIMNENFPFLPKIGS